MTQDASSLAWQQLAGLQPRLKAHLRMHAHSYRGRAWFVMEDSLTNRYHRFDASAWAFLRQLDGETTVEAALAQSQQGVDGRNGRPGPVDERNPDDASAGHPAKGPAGKDVGLSRSEVIGLMARLHGNELLATGLAPRTEAILKRLRQLAEARWQRSALSPLSIRVPMFSLDGALDRLRPLARAAFSLPALAVWCAVVCVAALVAAKHWSQLTHHFDTRALDPHNILLIWLLYPAIKVLHELGHALALKRWGGRVGEMGVVLLVFTPVPYVDANASIAFGRSHQRAAVAGAGILVEILLAAVAIIAWSAVAPGLVRDLLFNVALIGIGSTVLFNGNPLLRFDGYFVLSDALDMPNLYPRANAYWMHLGRRYLLGMTDSSPPPHESGERTPLVVYGAASFVYRTVVLLAIALYLASEMFFLGVILALWVMAVQLVLPLLRLVRYLSVDQRLAGKRPRALAAIGATFAAVVGFALLVPMPDRSFAHGVVQAPAGSELRVASPGFVGQTLRREGDQVRRGDTLLVLSDDELASETERLNWRVRELDQSIAGLALTDRNQAQSLAAARKQAEAELADARARLEALTITSPVDGVLALEATSELDGRFLQRGERLGLVLTESAPRLRVAVMQEDADAVRSGTDTVFVRLASRPGQVFEGGPMREIPAGTRQLANSSLGTRGGGLVAVDARDPSGTTALEPIFEFEIELPGRAADYRPGTRAAVLFEHRSAPLATQWYRKLRQLFIDRLEV